ncbi:MAG: aminodeoxychorismate synthase component I [Gammaproteobacteria bacterium]|jgi:para-aminobenzoate synthetase component 1|nr:aminodeoxychorismate synthase component I [Gammaproteobacteria bacterium]
MDDIVFPLISEIACPDPIALMTNFSLENAIFLDSARKDNKLGRYSFVGISPFQVITCKNKMVTIGDKTFHADPFEILENELKRFQLLRLPDYPPFQGGVAGMLGYELGGYLEKLPQTKEDDLQFPEMILGFYDLVIAWDHLQEKSWIFSSGFPESSTDKRLQRAQERMAWAIDCIAHPIKESTTPVIIDEKIESTFSEKSYQEAVEKVIEYIRAGDIFEANISQRFSTRMPETLTPFMLYCKLRQKNPAPFAAFLQHKGWSVASASPERFLKLHDHHVEARPIKGTRPRFQDSEKDHASQQELIHSEKDWAENVMIVDLMRNDLSRVCLAHSINVPQLCKLESFATVHHLVSVVEGKLNKDNNTIDLLKATFPGGSITGAPKIRAMEIISEIEPKVRGPYCGSMGYIGFNGDMDLSITIRTYAISEQMITFQTGGAITVDSQALEEYEETLVKAHALRRTLLEP